MNIGKKGIKKVRILAKNLFWQKNEFKKYEYWQKNECKKYEYWQKN